MPTSLGQSEAQGTRVDEFYLTFAKGTLTRMKEKYQSQLLGVAREGL